MLHLFLINMDQKIKKITKLSVLTNEDGHILNCYLLKGKHSILFMTLK
jgi:hypothetical protein